METERCEHGRERELAVRGARSRDTWSCVQGGARRGRPRAAGGRETQWDF